MTDPAKAAQDTAKGEKRQNESHSSEAAGAKTRKTEKILFAVVEQTAPIEDTQGNPVVQVTH